jgi:curved DNA-binding protein CbpA
VFKAVSEAHRVLTDPVKRGLYDAEYTTRLSKPPPPGFKRSRPSANASPLPSNLRSRAPEEPGSQSAGCFSGGLST